MAVDCPYYDVGFFAIFSYECVTALALLSNPYTKGSMQKSLLLVHSLLTVDYQTAYEQGNIRASD